MIHYFEANGLRMERSASDCCIVGITRLMLGNGDMHYLVAVFSFRSYPCLDPVPLSRFLNLNDVTCVFILNILFSLGFYFNYLFLTRTSWVLLITFRHYGSSLTDKTAGFS